VSKTPPQAFLGINSAYHESAAALLIDGEVKFAVEEERLVRTNHAKPALISNPDELPWAAIRACLDAGGMTSIAEVDAIGYSLTPHRRMKTIGKDPYEVDRVAGFGTTSGEQEFDQRVVGIPNLLAEFAGRADVTQKVQFIPHHRAHAASAFFCSPFRQAALLVVDGIGEDSTAWLGIGTPSGTRAIEEIPYPQSIGMLWERIAVYLGFTEYDACKVMGLAAYGDPHRFDRQFDRLFCVPGRPPQGRAGYLPPFVIDPLLSRFRSGDVLGLEALFGPKREPGDAVVGNRFADVAAGLQKRTESALLSLCHRLARATGERNLAYAGGVALNCVANARLERDGPFDALYIIGAAHDAGTAIGAAVEVAGRSLWPKKSRPHAKVPPFLGPKYTDDALASAVRESGLESKPVEDPAAEAALLITQGHVVGWFQGPLEFGPRALGGRSLLADPRNPGTRDNLNRRIKHRETFRPFGASVLADQAADWFQMPNKPIGAASARDLMLLAYAVSPGKAPLIPAVVHCDGTCRIQTVDRVDNYLFYRLIKRFFELTGVPLVLNTSFNDQEPLVGSPKDALRTFFRTGIDALFLGNRFVRRAQQVVHCRTRLESAHEYAPASAR
jgi:carbamoyltransferase